MGGETTPSRAVVQSAGRAYRLSSNELTMTQERIANILGVRREGVTEAAGNLQEAGSKAASPVPRFSFHDAQQSWCSRSEYRIHLSF